MHFFILVIVISLKLIDFLEDLKEDLGWTRLVMFALVDEDFLEFAFDAFYYLLGVVGWHYFIMLAIEEDNRDI